MRFPRRALKRSLILERKAYRASVGLCAGVTHTHPVHEPRQIQKVIAMLESVLVVDHFHCESVGWLIYNTVRSRSADLFVDLVWLTRCGTSGFR